MCQNERKWTQCTDMANKRHLKTVFIDNRKQFDRTVQMRKRQYRQETQQELLQTCNTGNTGDFWKIIGKIGMGSGRNKDIPLEIVQEDGTITSSLNKVSNKWQTSFEELFTDNSLHGIELNEIDATDTGSGEDTQFLNSSISIVEVAKTIKSFNKNKSPGYDEIPVEVLQSDSCINFLHRLFCTCFESRKISKSWSYGVITPVLKHSSSDSRDPSNYRRITVTSAVYKAYCYILNERLTDWSERFDKISDCQNGFRKNRSTMDHLSTLTNIIKCRKKLKKSTFVTYVDFSKAYDRIDCKELWAKLRRNGIHGKFYDALQSLYSSVKCSVKVNHHFTQWFDVSMGLKLGCVLSTTLFNIYINDFSELLDQCQRGVLIDNKIISHVFYADDLVLMAESAEDFQVLLDILSTWCISNKMNINTDKTKIMHFRTPSVVRTDYMYIFTCGESQIEIVDTYRYLRILLNDTLDYDITAKYIAQSATRALGLLISKLSAAGSMPFDVFTKLYDTIMPRNTSTKSPV